MHKNVYFQAKTKIYQPKKFQLMENAVIYSVRSPNSSNYA